MPLSPRKNSNAKATNARECRSWPGRRRHRPVNSAVDGGAVVERTMGTQGSIGFDALGKRYVDLVEAGILDPTKVVRIALEDAVSVSSVLLLTEASMTEEPQPKAERREAELDS